MKTALFTYLFCAATCIACSSGSTSGGASGSSQISGTVGGKAFVLRSGLARVADDKTRIDIVLSDADAVCTSLTQKKVHAGETLVQAYGLFGMAPGKFAPKGHTDIKYASVKPDCAAGQSVEGQVDKKGGVTSSDFDIIDITTTTVEGNLTITFDDGSSVTGRFSVPICPDTDGEHATCY